MVPPKHALCLTLTLHELATNAAKYGALSPAGGKLKIVWNVSVDSGGQRLQLTWTESGVTGIDPSAAKPSFGSRLIRNAIVHDLQGSCEYDPHAFGSPLHAVVPVLRGIGMGVLSGRKIVILEDEYLIALDARDHSRTWMPRSSSRPPCRKPRSLQRWTMLISRSST